MIGGFVSHLSMTSHHLMSSQSMQRTDNASSSLPSLAKCSATLYLQTACENENISGSRKNPIN